MDSWTIWLGHVFQSRDLNGIIRLHVMLTLYDNPFSPFARKVRMVLRFKGLEFESIDALALDEHDRLVEVNPRAEVPVLVDREFTVTDSTDIVYYLEDRFPTPAVFPAEPELRAKFSASSRIRSMPEISCAAIYRSQISRCSLTSQRSSRLGFYSKNPPTRDCFTGIGRCAHRRPYSTNSST